jgi:hypothetical protein
MDFMDARQMGAVNVEQHNVMTGLNNLANMLTESLDQMQQQMMQMQGMGKACKMPKSQGMGMKQLGEMQQQLNQMMQQMLQQQGGEGEGDEGKQAKLQEFAKQQEAIRKALKEAYEKMKQEGREGLGSLGKIAEDMQETEEQLKQKELTHEMMVRQRQILNRMLDFDKAMREQEYDKQRQGRKPGEFERTNPAELAPELLQERIRREQFNRNQFQYAPAYREMIEQYYKLLNGDK